MILIPERLAKEIACERQLTEAEVKKRDYEYSVRRSIESGLESFAIFLDRHGQTTHGSMGPFTIGYMADMLVQCWLHPSEFNVSELAQVARKITAK